MRAKEETMVGRLSEHGCCEMVLGVRPVVSIVEVA
jgi:hypothetical protein